MKKSLKKSLYGFLFAVAMIIAAPMISSTVAKAAPNFGLQYFTSSAVQIYADNPYYDATIQFEVRTYGNTLVKRQLPYTSDSKRDYSSKIALKKNSVYKYRVRYYNKYNNTYDAWSEYKYILPNLEVTGKTSAAHKGKISLKIRKISWVKSYKIYVSTTSSTSGYKCSKTVNCGSASYISTYISNYVKRGQRCYIKVIPVLKNGKTPTICRYLYFSKVY